MHITLQVAIGGAIGAVGRHLVGTMFVRNIGSFPWHTMTVNVLGSFVMGVVAMVFIRRSDLGLQHFAPFLMTGILGGFTTFSAFSLETYEMIERGRVGTAVVYAGGSVLLGVAAFASAIHLLRGWVAT